jgi:sulfite dehydrogenase (quinone) subunit SoeA
MAAAGIYTLGGAFWEFGAPDWDRTRLFLLFGVAEDHDSNPIKIGIGKLKARGAKVIGINPVRTGYNAVADDWYGITPGTDGLLILSLVHCLLKAGHRRGLPRALDERALPVDSRPRLARPRPPPARRRAANPSVIDRRTGKPRPFDTAGVQPDLGGSWPRGRHAPPRLPATRRALPVRDYAPETVADRTGIPAARIRACAPNSPAPRSRRPWSSTSPGPTSAAPATRTFTGRPVAMHAMRGISAHSNGFQTARALHLLQAILGTVETPGGWRIKPPYPKPPEAHPRPHATPHPGQPLDGPHLGFPLGPDDLCLCPDGTPAASTRPSPGTRPCRRPRPDAHGHRQRPGATRTPSTR